MEDHFINSHANNVTHSFFDYLRPLLGSNLPQVARFREHRVPKKAI